MIVLDGWCDYGLQNLYTRFIGYINVMSGFISRQLDPQYLHLYRKCMVSYRVALTDLAYCRYPECLWNMYDVLEFFWKTVYFLRYGNYPQHHLPNFSEYQTISSFLKAYLSKKKLLSIQTIFHRYNPRWQTNPQQRMQPRYGDEKTGIIPSKLYNRKVAERSVRHSSVLVQKLSNIHRRIMKQQSAMMVGVLNGGFSRTRQEIWCNEAPAANEASPKKWKNFVSGIPNVQAFPKTISELDNSLCCVINPFGEAYPEKPFNTTTLPAYELIRDYVFSGGVFISCGGLPFTYYFDVTVGPPLKNTSTVVSNIPVAIRLVNQGGMPQFQVLGTTLLINNLVEKDFGIKTVMDDPVLNRLGPTSVQIYQCPQDSKLLKCTRILKTFNVFRPTDPTGSISAIPIIRAQMYGREVFPVAFVRYGFGIFLHIGLNLSEGQKGEFTLAKEVVKGLLSNYSRFF
jgi:hypothetical protein